jgi:hypothetical protein
MIRNFLIIAFLVILLNLTGIDFIPASGENVEFRIQDSLAYYHEFSDDQHWYGSNSWAVRFDFRNYFQGIPAQFTTSDIWIYFPNSVTQGNINFAFYLENVNQPDLENPLLQETVDSAEVEIGWNVFPFSETVLDSVVWVIINYETSETGQYMSASAGGGQHSFYYDESYEAYYSMSSHNFNSEFLVCLQGEFGIDVIDIGLNDFYLSSELSFSEEVYPLFLLQNYHSEVVDSIFILYSITSPYYSVMDTVPVPNENYSLEPGEELLIDLSGEIEYLFTLPDTASQYRFSATILCSDDVFAYNNSIILDYELFTRAQNFVPVENFIQLDDTMTSDLWLDQSQLLSDEIFILNNFPVLADLPFFNNSALERFNFYSLYGFPATVTGGTEKIIGYNPAYYLESLSADIANIQENHRTYVGRDSIYATLNEFTNSASFKIYLENDSTFVFSSYLNQLTFYVALIEDSLSQEVEIPGHVLRDIIVEKSSPVIGYGSVDSTSFTLDLGSIEPIVSLNKCSIVYWLQHNETGRIDYLNSTPYIPDIDYDQITSAPEENIPERIEVNIYPNPFISGNQLNFELSSNRNIDDIKIVIYNIKGQLVRTINSESLNSRAEIMNWDGIDSSGREVGSGVYFMKISSADSRFNAVNKKCVFIRNR